MVAILVLVLPSRIRWLSIGTIAVVVAASLVVALGGESVWGAGEWESTALHGAFSASCALLSFGMAALLWSRRAEPRIGRYWVASIGFAGMGVYDCFAAGVSSPELMEIFHVSSAAAGALWLGLTLVPRVFRPIDTPRPWPLLAAFVNVAVALVLLIVVHDDPSLVREGWLGAAARIGEHVAGVLLFAVGMRFFVELLREGRMEDALFAAFGILSALSRLTGIVTHEWHTQWWIWHGMKLVAFGGIMAFLMFDHRRMVETLTGGLASQRSVEEKLRRSERQYRLLAENVADVIWVCDLDLRFTYVSPSVKRLSGRTPEEEIATPLTEKVTQETAGRLIMNLTEELALEASGTADPGRTRLLEMELLRKDGSLVPAETTVSIVRDEDGKPVGLLGITRDVSERKRQEAEKRKLESMLIQAQRMEGLGRLAGGIAHDFNNMLSVIINFAQFVADDLPQGDPKADDVAEIKKAARRGADLTRQLLEFSRKQAVSPEVMDLGFVVRDMEGILHRTIGEDVALDMSLVGKGHFVEADPGRIQQVLMNLIVNSRDALPAGGSIHVSVDTEEVSDKGVLDRSLVAGLGTGRHVRLQVRDTGTGMSEQVVTRAFDPFFTTKPKGKGTGLGLSTVYGIVTQAKGSVAIDSKPGRGTTVSVWLPEVEEGDGKPRHLSSPPPSSGKGRTVLVVEDEPAVLDLITRILSKQGYTVLAANSPERSLELSRTYEGKVDLLLTDVIMPGLSGAELADVILADRPGTRVLFMSGYTDDVIGEHGVLEEGVDFIHKPFEVHELIKKVAGSMMQELPADRPYR